MASEVDQTMSADEKERIANQKLKEEFVKIQNENKKLEVELNQIGFAGQQTTVEIDKLRAELQQLTAPWKTLPFYLSVATVTVSFVLALIAGYGVFLQETLARHAAIAETRKLDAKQEELNREKARLEKKQDDFDVQKKGLGQTTRPGCRAQGSRRKARSRARGPKTRP